VRAAAITGGVRRCFSALQRAENSSNGHHSIWHAAGAEVSVLFSEPKIPQMKSRRRKASNHSSCFSALQRAENSSKRWRKDRAQRASSFSALQRAENSSKIQQSDHHVHGNKFQCSSASRKFLKATVDGRTDDGSAVSVLFSEPKIPQSH